LRESNRSRSRRAPLVALASVLAAMVTIAGCGPVRLTATANIPTPLVVKVPIGVALFVPKEFSEHVHKEERWGTNWNVDLGKAQTEALTRLMSAMFERVVTVDSFNAGTQAGLDVSAIFEPSIEEYAFVTPRDAGSPFYAVSIKYRVNVYSPDGKLADSWGFTGYGTSPSQGISSTAPLAQATSLALRDAGAKLAVEFREQAVVRGLLPGGQSVDAPPPPAAPPTPAPEPEPATETAPAAAPTSEAPATGEIPAATEPAATEAPPADGAPKDEPADEDDEDDGDPAEGDTAPDQPEQPEEKPPVDPEALAVT
jgi:hypothetical protein